MAQKSSQRKLRILPDTEQIIYYVAIPGAMIKELGWKEKTKLVVSKSGNKITIDEGKGKKLSNAEAKQRLKKNTRRG